MKKKIMHVFGKMDRGGAETFVLNLLREIDNNNFEFHFLVSNFKPGDYDQEIKKLGGIIHTIKNENKLNYFLEIYNLLKKERIDIFHTHVHFASGFYALIAKFAKVPNIITHSHTEIIADKTIKRKIYEYIMRASILMNSTYLLGCSEKAIKNLYGKYKKNKIIKINNAIDLLPYQYTNKSEIEKLRLELGISPNKKIFGHVGRFDNFKNQRFLVDVFQQILKKERDIILLLIGDGETKKELTEIVNERGLDENIKFLGKRTDIPNLLNLMDMFIFPSIYEGLPLALVEAQAAGITTIVSTSVSKEVDMGNNNILFLDLKYGEKYWADKILTINSSRDDRSIINIQNKEFDIKSIVKKIERIYFQIE